MTYLVRKYNPAKWPKVNFEQCEIGNIRADAVTSCLRTSNDTLSTWEIENLEDVDQAALALASKFERIDKFDVLVFPKNDITSKGFELESTEGNTFVEDLKNTHIDIKGLTYNSIGQFSKLLINTLGIEGHTKRYTAKNVKKLLNEAIQEERLDPTLLHQGLLKELS